jgi:excinuclease UvrABC nuclease subunit
MKIDELDPLPTNKLLFKLSSYRSVPQESGCYVLTTFDGEVLYIGLTDNLYRRFHEHLDNPEKTSPTSAGKAIWFYFTCYDNANLQKLERTWLNQCSALYSNLPILNKVNSPIS